MNDTSGLLDVLKGLKQVELGAFNVLSKMEEHKSKMTPEQAEYADKKKKELQDALKNLELEKTKLPIW